MSSSVLTIDNFRFLKLKNHLIGKSNSFSSDCSAAAAIGLRHALIACSVGEALVESGRPYARIHYWGCYSEGRDRQFRVEVGCYSTEMVAEWFIPEVSEEESLARLKRVNGKSPKIPWHEIREGLHWYTELDPSTRYWRILEEELLKTSSEEIHRGTQKERSRKIEQKLRFPSFGIWEIGPKDSTAIAYLKQCLQDYRLAVGKPDGWSKESLAFEHATREFRKSQVRISKGIHNGSDGYFTRYAKNDQDICITFAKRGYDVRHFVEDCPRISWKHLDAGGTIEFESFLGSYFLRRAALGDDKRILYCNLASLNPIAFYDCVAELSEQYGN